MSRHAQTSREGGDARVPHPQSSNINDKAKNSGIGYAGGRLDSRTTLALIKALFPIRPFASGLFLASSEHLFNSQVAYSVPLHCTLAPLLRARAHYIGTQDTSHMPWIYTTKTNSSPKLELKWLHGSKAQGPLNPAHGYPRRRWGCVRL